MNLENVKVGDVLAFYSSYHGGPVRLTVERTTATQITAGGWRFTKRTGRSLGGGAWESSKVKPWTADDDVELAKAEREKKRRMLAGRFGVFRWRDLDLATLEAVAAIVLPKDSA